ncbi:MAG: hypothetical protein OXG85_16945 [Chloroflexi bacterium]|nr:hypothetical protein [Chloroflexota bacterium]
MLIVLRTFALLTVTLLALELALQAAFTHLPPTIVEPMPQYLERFGHRLTTEHGGREFPAGEAVEYEVTPLSGDLYHISCLSPADAQPLEPYRVSFKRDHRGFRNVEPWPDDLDLVVLGDSFTAAEHIQRPYWEGVSDSILVLAAPGTGTLEQQRYFEAFARQRNPKRVVLAFFAGNDMNDNQLFSDMLRQGKTRKDRQHEDKNPLDYSVVFRLLHFISESTTLDGGADCHYPLIAQTDPPAPVAFFYKFFPLLSADKESLLQSEAFKLTRTSISEMATALGPDEAELIVMYIPAKAELYWQYLDETSKRTIIAADSRFFHTTNLEEIDVNLSAQRAAMRELADEIDVSFLDLTPPLAEVIRAGSSPYFFADTHWNQTGHNIARNALLDFLNQSNLET